MYDFSNIIRWQVSPRTPRRNQPATTFIVNERGHLINRKDKTPHFKKLPGEGNPGSTPRRWPTNPQIHGPSGSQSFAYSPRGNMGYKGIPCNLGHTNTVHLPTKCTSTNTKGDNSAPGPYSPRNNAPWVTGDGPNATGIHTLRRPSSRQSRSSRRNSSQKRGWRWGENHMSKSRKLLLIWSKLLVIIWIIFL